MKKILSLVMVTFFTIMFSTQIFSGELVKAGEWSLDIEAESGNISGTAMVESGFTWASNGKKVGWLQNNESNNVVIDINNIPTDGEYDMDLIFESGEDRHLVYKVNNGEGIVMNPLNSGGWNKPSIKKETINLKKGNNNIKFFADSSLGYGQHGAAIDKITIKKVLEKRDLLLYTINESKEILNSVEIGEEQGMYPQSAVDIFEVEIKNAERIYNNNQLKEIEYVNADNKLKSAIVNLNNEVIKGDSKPNTSEKEDYRLIFEDNFDGDVIDESKWVNSYLTSWVSDVEKAKPVYEMKDGKMSLILPEEIEPWCPEFDGDTRVTGFMTGNRTGLHNWTGTNTARTEVEKNITNMTQYGYFEMRAKMQVGGGIHTAWWLTGFEDESGHSAEIDIFEILGRSPNTITSTKHPWKDPNVKYKTTAFTPEKVDLANEFHNYGFEWTEDEMIFYFDGQEYQKVPNDIFYPMTMLISLYEKRSAGSWTGPFDPTVPYPKTFDIDYLRIYKNIPNGYNKVEESKLEIVSQDEQIIKVKAGEYEIIENEIKGSPSWVTLRYNDGTDTQQWSKWEPISEDMKNKLNTPGETFSIEGEIMGLSDKLVNGRKAKLKVFIVK